jgi:hypothetical protein
MMVFTLVMVAIVCLTVGFGLGQTSINVSNKDNDSTEGSIQEIECNVDDIGDIQEVKIETILTRIKEENFLNSRLGMCEAIIRALAKRKMSARELGETLGISIRSAAALCHGLTKRGYITRTEVDIGDTERRYYYSLFPSLVAQ